MRTHRSHVKIQAGVDLNMAELKKGTILYVEDNSDNRNLIRRVLEAEGYSVIDAVNASQAIEKLEKNRIDLILMDINMPDMDGYTLTTKIKGTNFFQKFPSLQ